MQAIRTYHVPCTNTKPTRIAAECEAARRYYTWDSVGYIDDNHRAAAERLADELGWRKPGRKATRLVGGSLRDGSMAWVFVPEATS